MIDLLKVRLQIRMKNKIALMICMIFLMTILPAVSAETYIPYSADADFVVKQNTCLNLIQTCGLCTQNNITNVLYPNTTQAVGIVEMTKDGGVYNYTFCNTSEIGTYVVNGIGDLEGDGIGVIWRYTFEVNPTGGLEKNTTMFLIFIFVSTGLLLISLLFKNYIFAVISGFSFLITGVYTMINGFGFITSANTQMLSIIIIGFGAIVTITAGLEVANSSYSQTQGADDFED